MAALKKNNINKSERTTNKPQTKKTPSKKTSPAKKHKNIEKQTNSLPKKSQKLKQQDNVIKCPHCGSDQLTVGKHSINNGFDATSALVANYLTKSSLAGFLVGGLNSGGTESELFVYCFNCQAEFSPDELSQKLPAVKKDTPMLSPTTNHNSGYGCNTIFIIIIILLIIFAVVDHYTGK